MGKKFCTCLDRIATTMRRKLTTECSQFSQTQFGGYNYRKQSLSKGWISSHGECKNYTSELKRIAALTKTSSIENSIADLVTKATPRRKVDLIHYPILRSYWSLLRKALSQKKEPSTQKGQRNRNNMQVVGQFFCVTFPYSISSSDWNCRFWDC